MHDFLSSPIWQFVGALLAFLAVIISLTVYLKQRQQKKVSYSVISSTPLLSVQDDIKGRVEILFDQRRVEDVQLFIIRIINSGNVSISKNDYEEPITLDFGTKVGILGSEIIDTSPRNLTARIQTKDSKIILEEMLLNAGDSITVKSLVTGGKELTVVGRIQGVKEILNIPIQDESLKLTTTVIVVLGTLSFFVGIPIGFVTAAYGLSDRITLLIGIGSGVIIPATLLGIRWALLRIRSKQK